jgi:monoamine oxidase
MDSGLKVALRFKVPWWETEGLSLAWLVTEGIAGACWIPSDYKDGSSSFIMMCYPMGRNAVALSDIAAEAGGGEAGDEAISQAILKDLDDVFPGALGEASENFLDALVQNWGAEPYTLGAYSYPTLETSNSATDSQRQVLKRPLAGNRIFIAGEATHETHSATVVGALHEGERAAMEIHAVNGNPGNPPAMPVYLTVPAWERYRRPSFLPDLNLEPGDP